MALRIQDHVRDGEIDNRTKGIVRGELWLEGVKKPLQLQLRGNAWPDVAGCILKFKNPGKTRPLGRDFQLAEKQVGFAGDITASRKVRRGDGMAMGGEKKKSGEAMGNCLYLEWFSDLDERVVLEGMDWELEISAPEWRLSPQEEEQRAKDAAAAMSGFLQKFTDAVENQKQRQPDPETPWDEHDYERFFKQCDASGDKYKELLEKYGGSPEGDEIIEREMGWNDEATSEDEIEAQHLHIEEMNRIAEEALNELPAAPEPNPEREGIDWMRTKDGEIRHPLEHRCQEEAIKYGEILNELVLDEENCEKAHEFVFELQTTSAKLAGALDSVAEGGYVPEAAFTVAYLKRALHHLHRSQSALAGAQLEGGLPEEVILEAQQELLAIRQKILELMDEFRGRKK